MRALVPLLLLLLTGCSVHPFAFEPPPPPSSSAQPLPGPADQVWPTAPPTAPPGPCPKPGVRITPGASDAAMGLRVMTLEMTNCGAAPYEVNGRPVVLVLNKEDQAEPVAVLPGSGGITVDPEIDAAPQPLTLAPGEKARATLVWRLLVQDGRSVTGTSLRVAPLPGEPDQLVSPVHLDVGSTGKLGVGPWSTG